MQRDETKVSLEFYRVCISPMTKPPIYMSQCACELYLYIMYLYLGLV